MVQEHWQEHWTVPDRLPLLSPHEVHVWQIALDEDGDVRQRFGKDLIASECQRADRFLMQHHRDRFLVGRARMRRILGGYLQLDACDVPLCYEALGKPFLDPAVNALGVQFNFSNSHACALLAVSLGNFPLGVDLEHIRPGRDFHGLANRFFHPHEFADIWQRGGDHPLHAFYRCWTRKEAFLKAIGKGLTFPLNEVVVTCHREDPTVIKEIAGDQAEARQWTLHSFAPQPDYCGALAYRATPRTMQLWQWSDDRLASA